MSPEKGNSIFGIEINCLTLRSVVELLYQRLKKKGEVWQVATVNPEYLVEVSRNPVFKKVLKETDLRLVDGNGLLWALRFLAFPLKLHWPWSIVEAIWVGLMLLGYLLVRRRSFSPDCVTVTGVDLLEGLLTFPVSSVLGRPVRFFLLGSSATTREGMTRLIGSLGSDAEISSDAGALDIRRESGAERKRVLEKIAQFRPDFLFVAYGSPWQDSWVAQNKQAIRAKVAIGVGGALDILSGQFPRAPFMLRRSGLEWFWRFLLQPKRVRRIFRAVVVFPFLVLLEKLGLTAIKKPR